jgi:hypothetical protein
VAHSFWIVRKLVVTFGILVVCGVGILAAWIFGGRQLSLFIDRFGTIEINSTKVNSIAYEGSGTGGILIVNEVRLSLNEPAPHLSLSIGSTKDNQFALASGGKVFALGPLATARGDDAEHLAAVPPSGDEASLVTRRGFLSWPTPFDFNFMTGQSPSWKRDIYYQLHWKKSSGAKLEMLWRYEQYFYSGNGWANGFMTREGSTGLIKIDIRL